MADKTLIMTFINQEGKKASLRLNGVKEDLTEEQISSAMDIIVTNNLFLSSGGELKAKDSAQIVEKNIAKYDVK